MRITFQQRKYVYNRLVNLLLAKALEATKGTQTLLEDLTTKHIDAYLKKGPSAKEIKDAITTATSTARTYAARRKKQIARNRTANHPYAASYGVYTPEALEVTIKIPAVKIPQNLDIEEVVLSTQLISKASTFRFPKSQGAKFRKVISELKKLEEDMFLKDAPALRAALEKVEAKIQAL